MYEIDNNDLKIVKLLMKDGRMSASEIAREIGDLSERSIRYRIQRMVDDGLIKVSAIVNPKAFGFEVIADVWVDVESSFVSDVAKKLVEFTCVSYVATAIGEKDISVQICQEQREYIDLYRGYRSPQRGEENCNINCSERIEGRLQLELAF
jgi:Lrp/AsnC family transcriptional regulator for asnA, asnC and gidA